MVSRAIKEKIVSAHNKKYWSAADFPEYKAGTVLKTLSRLAEKGFIDKVKNDLYYRPKQTILGSSRSDVTEIIKTDNNKFLGGLHAYYNLGLTTQIPAVNVVVSENRKSVPNSKIIKRSISHLKNATEKEFWVLESLRNIKSIPDCTPDNAIIKIKAYLKSKQIDFARLAKFSLKEPPRVRAILGAIGEEIKADKNLLNKLKNSLNPISIYKIGISNSLKHKAEWNIR